VRCALLFIILYVIERLLYYNLNVSCENYSTYMVYCPFNYRKKCKHCKTKTHLLRMKNGIKTVLKSESKIGLCFQVDKLNRIGRHTGKNPISPPTIVHFCFPPFIKTHHPFFIKCFIFFLWFMEGYNRNCNKLSILRQLYILYLYFIRPLNI